MSNSTSRLQKYFMKKHHAANLHYDLRLGWNGVLKSFAIDDGPSDIAGIRRKAVQVEDHEMQYGPSERVIEKGKYGAGTLMLWDRGWYEPLAEYSDVGASLQSGRFMFVLQGERLMGLWTLQRRDESLQNEKKPIWDLIKEPDSFARNGRPGDILEEFPNSVKSGLSLKGIEHKWNNPEPKKKSDGTLFNL